MLLGEYMQNDNINEKANSNNLLGYTFTFRFAHNSYDRNKTINEFNDSKIVSKYLPKICIGTNFKKSVKMNIGNDKLKTLHFISEDKDFVTFQIDRVEHSAITDKVYDEEGSVDVIKTGIKEFQYDSKIIFDKKLNKVLGDADNDIVQKIYETINKLCGQYTDLDIRSALVKYIKKETKAIQFMFGSDVWIIPNSDKDKLDCIIDLLCRLDAKKCIYRLAEIMDISTNKETIISSLLDKFRNAFLETKDRIYTMCDEQKKLSTTIYKNNIKKIEALKLFHESYKSILNEPLKECEKYTNAIKLLNNGYYNYSCHNNLTDPLNAYKEVFKKLTPEQKIEFRTVLSEKANFPEELLELIEN